jgi:hypothetical protein
MPTLGAADDLATELSDAAVGTLAGTSGWGIYIGQEPDTAPAPDTIITLYDMGGDPPNPKFLFEEPTVRIRVRGAVQGYAAAYAKCVGIKDALLGLASKTIATTLYVGVFQLSDILFLNTDDKNRPVFSMLFRVAREPASGTNRTALS